VHIVGVEEQMYGNVSNADALLACMAPCADRVVTGEALGREMWVQLRVMCTWECFQHSDADVGFPVEVWDILPARNFAGSVEACAVLLAG
jgi:hypothetical protein